MEKTITLTVEASLWTKLVKLKSERASVEARIEELQKELMLPSGAEIAERYGLAPEDKARVILVDGTGDQRGKGSCSLIVPTRIPDPRWVARYS